ncbi:MAG: DNA methyltransferase [Geminicoccaceae bacterium]|nr:MAG: DNA methyltransferase [Geminicoccaceae bacterium]
MQSPPRAGHYRVIYADPPWSFATYSARGKGRTADAHYDTLDLEGIKALPVADWAAPDCVLFLWATDPLLPAALDVVHAWGFTYKTVGFYWAKLNKRTEGALGFGERDFFTGMGFWTRANPEPCLLATRGKPKRVSAGVKKLVVSPRREHSRKPDVVAERIEALVAGPYLELFARAARPGWDVWGNQTALFDQGAVETRRLPSTFKDR